MIARTSFAKEHIQNRSIFSDEKKFNLDGPDGLIYYWHDMRNEPRIRPSRVQGGGSLMIWGGFMGQTKCELAFVNGRMNALKYQGMLEDYLFPFITRLNDDEVIF